MDRSGLADEPPAEGELTLLHDPNRRIDLAFAAAMAIPAGAFVSCLSDGPGPERPSLLLERLPGVRWLSAAEHPLSYVDPKHQLRIHQTWVTACRGSDRVARTRVETCQALPWSGPDQTDPGSGGPGGDIGWYEVQIIDLTGVAGVDAVIVELLPSDPDPADGEELRSSEAPSWFRGTTSFRLRLALNGIIEGGTLNVDEVLGRPLTSLTGTSLASLVHPEDLDGARTSWAALTTTDDPTPPRRLRLSLVGGGWRWFEVTSWNVLNVPELGVVISEFRDVEDQIAAEKARLAASRAHDRMVRVVDEVDDMIMVGRLDVGLVYVNESAARIVGPDAVGKTLRSRLRPELNVFAAHVIEPAIRNLERWTGDVDVYLDGDRRTMATTVTPVVEDGHDDVFYGVIMHDVTEARQHAIAMADQARRDPLTGLPNRLALMEHLEGHRSDGRPQERISICFIDLDNLKVVNDGLGHSAGDRLLRAVGAELLAQPGEIVARFGGDEFVVVYRDLSDAEAVHAAQSLLTAIEGVHVPGVSSHVTASVGVASCARRDLDPEGIIRDADAAMYVAKRTGRARIVAFDDAMREVVSRRFSIESSLRQALDDERLELHLQPVADLMNGDRLSGFEGLARWSEAAPSEFIPVAEDSGLIMPLGRWALHAALASQRRMGQIAPELSQLRMGVNVSGHQLQQPGFNAMVADALAEHEVDPETVVLELTESVLIESRQEVDRVLRDLRDLGLSLALDDFGSGYSSLGYLRRYPIDVLKLDTTYTQALLTDPGTRIIAEAIVTLASRLGLRVVAEGVETPEELEVVRELGITWAQGYLLGRPAPMSEVEAGLAERHRPR
ncbi:hypothetical protein BH10ACT1_BH10ACT1_00200 [soil metagenome]